MRVILLFPASLVLAPVLFLLLVISYIFRLRSLIIWGGKAVLWVCAKIVGLRFDVSGKEWVLKGKTYVFMSNHLSFLDGPLLFVIIPQAVRIILKESLFRIPLVGQCMKQVEFVTVDRMGIKAGRRSIEKATHFIRDKKYSFLIFPEGTRSLDGKLKRFKRGGFFLALDSGVPIIPMSLKGTFELMPKGSFWIRRGVVKVKFHPPVSTENYTHDNIHALMEKVWHIIHSDLGEDE